jgi:hypothetical protein
LLLVLVGSLPSLRADDRTDALAVVDAAIEAHGGADALTKAQSFTRKGTGHIFPGDKPVTVTEELTVNLPVQLRLAADVQGAGKILLVLNGDKGWRSQGGAPDELGGERLKELADEAYVLWLTTLVPLKKDGVMLKSLPQMKVHDQPAVGVVVSAKDRSTVKLYFDKASHLLVKIEREAKQASSTVNKEYLYEDYKKTDGVQLPAKITELVGGAKFSELTAVSYQLHKPDEASFGKP